MTNFAKQSLTTQAQMRFDGKDSSEVPDINVESLWMIGPRAKGGKRENNYNGNFVPQIPEQMIRRYTQRDGVVLDMFMGSGTALFEAESLGRAYIGFDINEKVIEKVRAKMVDSNADFFIHNCDIANSVDVSLALSEDFINLNKTCADLIISHPPYLDIIKFTDKAEDLSNLSVLSDFLGAFEKGLKNVWPFLKSDGYFVLVVGDVWRDRQVLPLGFYMMDAVLKTVSCQLKGIVVKDIAGNRGKLGLEEVWKKRALKSDYFIFKHEYVFVFKKN